MSIATVRLDRALVLLLGACTIAALAGYAVFGLHPRLAGSDPTVARVYALAITGFPRVHIALGFITLLAVVTRATDRRWIASLVAVYAVSLASELLGTSVGEPFGPYRYTDALGPKWFGLVPLLIPVSWCTMTFASFIMARRMLAVRERLTAIAAGAALLIAWDLALDPAMSRLTPYWIWGVAGPYFGMPLRNLAGWFLTGLVLHAILFGLRAERWVDALDSRAVRTTLLVYAANLVLPVGMTVAAGIPLAAITALVVIGLTVLMTRRSAKTEGRVTSGTSVRELVR